jgi:hypothetical protein
MVKIYFIKLSLIKLFPRDASRPQRSYRSNYRRYAYYYFVYASPQLIFLILKKLECKIRKGQPFYRLPAMQD